MRTLLLGITSVLWLGACGGSGGEKPPASGRSETAPRDRASATAEVLPDASLVPLPAGPWTDLARRLVEADDLETAVRVTREVLARGGVATFDGDRVLVDAVAPAASFRATPVETVHLAMEARRRAQAARLTAAEFAQMLEGFGWPFPGGTAGGGTADRQPLGGAAEPDVIREAERAEQQARTRARQEMIAALEARVEAERQAGRERVAAVRQRVQEATRAWQRARVAASRARGSEKATAQNEFEAAAAARTAALEQLRATSVAESEADDERRTRVARARDEGYRLERMQARIGPDYAAGERLMDMLAAWVRGAVHDPGDARSFTPLFLAEMARLQDPPVDLLGSRYRRPGRGDGPPVDLRSPPRAAQLRFTLLELELIAAAFARGAGTSTSARFGPLAGRDDVAPASFTSAVQDPCSEFKQMMEDVGRTLGGDLGGAIGDLAAGEALGMALEKAIAEATGAAAAEAFGKAMSAIGSAARIAKLVAFYSDGQVAVTVEPRSIHKPVSGTELAGFTARAGVSEEDLAEYERLAARETSRIDRETRACLEAAGVPRFSNISDLANEARDWLVEWRLVEGFSHASFSTRKNDFYLPGRLAMKLTPAGSNSLEALFLVDILSEPAHTGTVVRAYVSARASVDAAGMPSLGTLVNPIKGILGLVDALVELGAGWFQYMNMPKAYGTIEVEYHCPRPTMLHPPVDGGPVGDGAGGAGPNDCVLAAGRAR